VVKAGVGVGWLRVRDGLRRRLALVNGGMRWRVARDEGWR